MLTQLPAVDKAAMGRSFFDLLSTMSRLGVLIRNAAACRRARELVRNDADWLSDSRPEGTTARRGRVVTVLERKQPAAGFVAVE